MYEYRTEKEKGIYITYDEYPRAKEANLSFMTRLCHEKERERYKYLAPLDSCYKEYRKWARVDGTTAIVYAYHVNIWEVGVLVEAVELAYEQVKARLIGILSVY